MKLKGMKKDEKPKKYFNIIILCSLYLLGILLLITLFNLTFSDTILFLTGLIILWYTSETYLLRIETQKQNEFEKTKAFSYSRPIFANITCKNNKPFSGFYDLTAKNFGGKITDVKIIAENGWQVKISNSQTKLYTDFINSDDNITFQFVPRVDNEDLPKELFITLNYKNIFSEQISEQYVLHFYDNKFDKIN